MPMWPTADSPALDRVVAAHREATGVEATHAADAPATWLLMGEHVDYAGGVVLVGQAAQRVAVAFSPRQDDLIRVTRHVPGADADTDEISTGAIAERAAGQQSGIDARGRTTTPPAPEGGLAARLAGIVWTMIHRQLLSRDTAGLDVTVVDDIPPVEGGAAADGPVVDHGRVLRYCHCFCRREGQSPYLTFENIGFSGASASGSPHDDVICSSWSLPMQYLGYRYTKPSAG